MTWYILLKQEAKGKQQKRPFCSYGYCLVSSLNQPRSEAHLHESHFFPKCFKAYWVSKDKALLAVYLENYKSKRKFDPSQNVWKLFVSPSVAQNNKCYCKYSKNQNLTFLFYKTKVCMIHCSHLFFIPNYCS